MTLGTAIMAAVALVLGLVGAGLLLALTRPRSPAQVYVFRMVGIMALAAAALLAAYAAALHRWSVAP